MRIDKTQRGWALASLAILTLSAFVYVLYALEAPQGPRGGSAVGLTFGVIGFAFMLFAALLGARKQVPTWRVGRAKAWMRGHLWLGFLALPMMLFHGGFHFGGTLTRVLMWLLIITVLSGVFGAALQHYIPRVMTADVPLETFGRCFAKKPIAPSSLCAAIWGFQRVQAMHASAREVSPRCGPSPRLPFRCALPPPSAPARAPLWPPLLRLFC